MSSSIPPATDSSTPAPSDRLWLRSELMGTQVITRDSGRRLGVVGEVVVDIDRREVVALGLRDNPLTRFLPGLPRWMPLASIRQVGDVILVDSADSLSESFDPERYSKVINCQVISESGVQLGRVLGFSFDIETGDLTTLVIGAVGVPLLGEGVLSTWELAVEEIVSSGTDRIIVYEGAEEKLRQLGTGLLEKLGIGGASWEQEERERFRGTVVPAENQLPAGQPSASEQRRIQPATSRAVRPESEFDYVELEERREREPLRQRRYLDEEERQDRWRDPYGDSTYSDSTTPERRWGEERRPEPPAGPRYGQARSNDDRYGNDFYDNGRNNDDRDRDSRYPGDRDGSAGERATPRREAASRYDRDETGPERREPELRPRESELRPIDRDSDNEQPVRQPGDSRREPDWQEPQPTVLRFERRSDERPWPETGPSQDSPRNAPRDEAMERRQDPGAMSPSTRPQLEVTARPGEGRPPRNRRLDPESLASEPIDVEPEVLDDPW
ncbi:MAG: PRC-barrel domain-containing protein [Cyanobium sp.]